MVSQFLKSIHNFLLSFLALSDKNTAVNYIRDLSINEIVDIGFMLGLTFETLRAMSTDKIHEEMITAWLLKKDGVASLGAPTWKSLGAALQKQHHNQITQRIRKGENG